MNPVLVAGTGSWDDDGRVDWYAPGHPFQRFLEDHGVYPAFQGGKPFVWSTDLGGVPWSGKRDWSAGGAALAYFVMADRRLSAANTALIVHSHGLQVAAFAAAEHDLKAATLMSFGSPLRADMQARYEALRRNVGTWLHVHSDGSDRWQWLGELFDGHFGVVRETKLADRNDFVPEVGHSELLRDPKQYHHWLEHGWLELLKG